MTRLVGRFPANGVTVMAGWGTHIWLPVALCGCGGCAPTRRPQGLGYTAGDRAWWSVRVPSSNRDPRLPRRGGRAFGLGVRAVGPCGRRAGSARGAGKGAQATRGVGERRSGAAEGGVCGVSALCAFSSTGGGACVARLGVCISLISPPPPGARWRQPGRNNRAQTNILVHRCTWHTHTTARFTWEQTAGGTVRTARSARDHTGTRAGSNGRRWPNGLRLLPDRPLHRETAWLGVGLRAD